MLEHMELRHLRYFLGVAEARSFSRAATRLRVTQPALSRQIRDLEQELGLRLFDRSRRQLDLTPEGADLLRRAQDALVVMESVRERARSLEAGRSGILRVGSTPQILDSVLAAFLRRYRRAHPGVDVQLIEQGAVRILELVQTGAVQLGIAALPAPTPLQARSLFPARILALTPPSDRPRRRRAVEVRELATERLLLLDRTFATRQIVDAAFQAARIHPRVVLESRDPHCLLTLAASGYGVAVVPSTVALRGSRVRATPLVHEHAALGFWVGACRDPRRFLPPHGERFVEELAAYTARWHPGRQFTRLGPPRRHVDGQP